jgi:curli biogenesis system outer membrane secretion channel CsgG
MKKLLAALVVGAFAFGCLPAMAQDKTQSFILTPAEQARLKAERSAEKAKFDAMTPEE